MTGYRLFTMPLLIGGLLLFAAADAIAQDGQRRDPGQFARGAKAWATQCARCHHLRNAKEMSDAQWSVVVSHMRLRANLPGAVARDVEAFLKASN